MEWMRDKDGKLECKQICAYRDAGRLQMGFECEDSSCSGELTPLSKLGGKAQVASSASKTRYSAAIVVENLANPPMKPRICENRREFQAYNPRDHCVPFEARQKGFAS
jgi:hypothetical protein